MPLTELRKLIERFKKQKDDTPIALYNQTARCYAIQEVLSMCSGDMYALIFFNEHGESELYDALADEHTSRFVANKLNDAKLHILTNDIVKVKTLNFVEKHINENIKNLRLTPIPKKLADEMRKDALDNEFFLSSPEHLIFMGRYKKAGPSESERLAEISAFLNFFDLGFFNVLEQYFINTVTRTESGEFR